MGSPFNIAQLFFDTAAKYPAQVAIVYRGRAITYKALEDEVIQTAMYLLQKGVKKGDRILIFVPMSIHLYRIVLAVFHIGAVAVFLDEWVNKKRMEDCCKIASCNVFIGIYKARVLALFSKELRAIQIKLGIGFSAKMPSSSVHITNVDDSALITFTTGSTARPKAADRTHGFLHEQFKALTASIQPQAGDITMPVLPIVLLYNLGVGSTSIIAGFNARKPQKMKPQKIYQQLIALKVRRIIASPFFIKQLSKYIAHHQLDGHMVDEVFTGGAPVFPAEGGTYLKAFANAKVTIVYGSTEAEPISKISAEDLVNLPKNDMGPGLNVGKPYSGIDVRIIKIVEGELKAPSQLEFEKLLLPDGKIGEIIVRGPHVLRRYFNSEAALRETKIFVGSHCWHRTGDSGAVVGENLFLTGRCSGLIYRGNKILSPFILEEYFQRMDGVEIGTIILFNQKLIAVIELKPRANAGAVLSETKKHALGFDEVKFIKKIPRDKRHFSKIDYQQLKEML